MKSSIPILVLCGLAAASPLPPPHPDVLAARAQEARLPPHQRSPALYNPRLREVLPLASLLHDGEIPVYDREANKVRRHEIYKILTHAGFFPRSRYNGHHQHSYPWHQQLQPPRHEPSNFPSPEQLQYL